MLGNLIETIVPELIHILEIMGICVIFFGSVHSLIVYLRSQIKRVSDSKFNVRLMLGRTLELGLEYKMGAEILKTVLIRDMSEIWILGSIIVFRGLLFALIHFEMRSETVRAAADKADKIANEEENEENEEKRDS